MGLSRSARSSLDFCLRRVTQRVATASRAACDSRNRSPLGCVQCCPLAAPQSGHGTFRRTARACLSTSDLVPGLTSSQHAAWKALRGPRRPMHGLPARAPHVGQCSRSASGSIDDDYHQQRTSHRHGWTEMMPTIPFAFELAPVALSQTGDQRSSLRCARLANRRARGTRVAETCLRFPGGMLREACPRALLPEAAGAVAAKQLTRVANQLARADSDLIRGVDSGSGS